MTTKFDWLDRTIEEFKIDSFFEEYFGNCTLDEGVDGYYLSNYEEGIELVLSKEKKLTAIHFFSGQTDEYHMFKKEIIPNISFNSSRNNVIEVLGQPNDSGGGEEHFIFGYINSWDRFFKKNYVLRFEYQKNEKSILLITFSSLTLEPNYKAALN